MTNSCNQKHGQTHQHIRRSAAQRGLVRDGTLGKPLKPRTQVAQVQTNTLAQKVVRNMFVIGAATKNFNSI